MVLKQVTMLRFVVEMANGRLKGTWKFFDHLIPASYFPVLNDFLKIAVAITNAFSPPLFNETEWHEKVRYLLKSCLVSYIYFSSA